MQRHHGNFAICWPASSSVHESVNVQLDSQASHSGITHRNKTVCVVCVCAYAANAGEFGQCLSANTGGAKTTSRHVILEKKE